MIKIVCLIVVMTMCTIVLCYLVGACLAPVIHAFVFGFKTSWKISKSIWETILKIVKMISRTTSVLYHEFWLWWIWRTIKRITWFLCQCLSLFFMVFIVTPCFLVLTYTIILVVSPWFLVHYLKVTDKLLRFPAVKVEWKLNE